MKLFSAVCVAVALQVTAAMAKDIEVLSPFTRMELPAAAGSLAPALYHTEAGTVHLTWVEPRGENQFELRLSRLEGTVWSAPRTLVAGTGWVVNGVNVPKVVTTDDGFMAACWLEAVGDHHATRVRIAQSFDDGKSWGEPLTPHTDNTATEHGFASMVPARDGLLIVWLDGRKFADKTAAQETSLRFARIDRQGKLQDEAELDGRVCDCCPTDAALFGAEILVVYRDRGDDELRDINTMSLRATEWSEPEPVNRDGWRVDACPVNGPAIDTVADMKVVAWFTGGDDQRVKLKRMASVLSVDDGTPLGRVDVVAMSHGAVVSWVEAVGDGAQIRVRYVSAAPAASFRIADTGAAWPNGIPRIIRAGGRVVAAWTDGENGVRAAWVDIATLMGVKKQ